MKKITIFVTLALVIGIVFLETPTWAQSYYQYVVVYDGFNGQPIEDAAVIFSSYGDYVTAAELTNHSGRAKSPYWGMSSIIIGAQDYKLEEITESNNLKISVFLERAGYCGDHMCQVYEDIYSCSEDCSFIDVGIEEIPSPQGPVKPKE